MEKVYRPKKKGGLGIINLRSQYTALLLKHLDKFYNRRDIPWINLIWNTYYSDGEVPHASKDRGSFWWKDLLKLCDIYIGIAKCSVGNGTTILFWSDVWNDHLLQDKFPRLYSFAKEKSISVARFLSTSQILKIYFISQSLIRHGRNINHYRLSYNKSKSQREKKTAGNTFGEILNIHHQDSTTYIRTTSSQQSHLSESGVPNVQIK
jgi:hypothetical protein